MTEGTTRQRRRAAEILGVDQVTTEDGAGWLAFPRSLVARGLFGVKLVISDARERLVDAIGSVHLLFGEGVAAVDDGESGLASDSALM